MAIDRSEFIYKIDVGLKANKENNKFFYRCKIGTKQYYKIFDYTNKLWDKRTRVNKAKSDSIEFKEKKLNPVSEISETIKLDAFVSEHFRFLPKTKWTNTKLKFYEQHISIELGAKKVKDIKQMHIKNCISKLQDIKLSQRTVRQVIEVLNPVFKEAIANRLITFNPLAGITIAREKTKKIVSNASVLLEEIYNTLMTVFKDSPFYLSLYMFALHGRRKSEIRNLKWENINFSTDRYLAEYVKNGDHQMFFLPEKIKEILMTFKEDSGYVYESPLISGKPIQNLECQTKKIKKLIPNFTLHYMRNVVVSAMAEQGASIAQMSGALGHNNTATLSKYLSLNYIQGSEGANKTIEMITKKDN